MKPSMQAALETYRAGQQTMVQICEQFGVSRRGLSTHIAKAGVGRRPAGSCKGGGQYRGVTGADHPAFKTGLSVNNYGYILVSAPSHPWPRKSNQIAQHICVMELRIGRRLARNEDVHHKDLDRQHNDPENLELMNYHDHRRLHALLRAEAKRAIPVTDPPDRLRAFVDSIDPQVAEYIGRLVTRGA